MFNGDSIEGTYIHISLCTLMEACIGPRVMGGESNEERKGGRAAGRKEGGESAPYKGGI